MIKNRPITLESVERWLEENPKSFLKKNIDDIGVSLVELNKYPTKLIFFVRIFSARFDERCFEMWAALEQAWEELNEGGFFNYDPLALRLSAIDELRNMYSRPSALLTTNKEWSLWKFNLNISTHDGKKYVSADRLRNVLYRTADAGTVGTGDLLNGPSKDLTHQVWEKFLKEDPGEQSKFPPERYWRRDVSSYKSWIISEYLNPESLQAPFLKLLESEYKTSSPFNTHTMMTDAPFVQPFRDQIVTDAYNLGKKILFKELAPLWVKLPDTVPNVILLQEDSFW